jgi:hypothetical protein
MHTRVVFLCSWDESPRDLLDFYAKQTPGGRGVWRNLIGVADLRDADYFVVMEGVPEGFDRTRLPKDRTICFPREASLSSERKNYEDSGFRYAFTYRDVYHVATWRIMRAYDELAALHYPSKTANLSTITSGLAQTDGHRQRTAFLRRFCERFPDAMDAYGHGWEQELGRAYRGELGDRFAQGGSRAICKYDGLIGYRYTLALENGQHRNYFTEKIVDAYLTWSLPVYWGCPNIGEFFPRESYRQLDIADPRAADRLVEIAQTPLTRSDIDALREARELVLQKYNLWPTIEEIVETGVVSWPGKRRSWWKRLSESHA